MLRKIRETPGFDQLLEAGRECQDRNHLPAKARDEVQAP